MYISRISDNLEDNLFTISAELCENLFCLEFFDGDSAVEELRDELIPVPFYLTLELFFSKKVFL